MSLPSVGLFCTEAQLSLAYAFSTSLSFGDATISEPRLTMHFDSALVFGHWGPATTTALGALAAGCAEAVGFGEPVADGLAVELGVAVAGGVAELLALGDALLLWLPVWRPSVMPGSTASGWELVRFDALDVAL